jgi:hypothetical protein
LEEKRASRAGAGRKEDGKEDSFRLVAAERKQEGRTIRKEQPPSFEARRSVACRTKMG